METIFTLSEHADDIKLNLDELYEHKKQHDMNTLALYNRILARIHSKIKLISRQQIKEQFCWYVVPEMIIGVPKFDNAACTAYIIDQLRDNGFVVRYTHPNLVFVSWANWCPSYVRSEIKKKTGIVIDGHGNTIDKDDVHNNNNSNNTSSDTNNLMLNLKKVGGGQKEKEVKIYKQIDTYKPSGLIYNEQLLKSIEDKTHTIKLNE